MKTSRLVLLAAQLCCAGLMSEATLAGNARTVWSDLWRTPDQQGQALLDAGRPAQAAQRFHDPRRRAYADLEAARYQEAAKELAPFTDADSEYNRGNALARSGQLQAALAAYDAALKQAPADRDIRHNRDLVERALRQQRRSQRPSGNGRQGGQGTPSSGQQPQQSAARQQGGSGSRQSGSGSRQGGARGPQAQPTGGGQAASSGSQAGANPQGSFPSDPNSFASSKEGPGQAQRDAAFAAALARKQQQRGGPGSAAQAQGLARNGTSGLSPKGAAKAPDAGSFLAGGTQTPRQKPESERELALDQWLRQIPDSPAGLLQRKFLIEHMMKQQGGDEPQESEAQQGSGP
jgi:Ca-activated chloride channel homolog